MAKLLVFIMLFTLCAVPLYAKSGDVGPSFTIGKISFKGVHPDAGGFYVFCITSKVKGAAPDWQTAFTQWMGENLVSMGEANNYSTFFKDDPARRIKSEASNIKIATSVMGSNSSSVSEAKSWMCLMSINSNKGSPQFISPASDDFAKPGGGGVIFLSGVF